MRQEEGRLAEALCAEGYLTVVDGPLNFVRSRDLPVVGYVKTHHRALLDPDRHRLIPALDAGQRSSLFRLGEDRYSAYLRLTPRAATSSPWSGVVRIELPQSAGLRAAIEIRSRWPGTPVLVLSQYVEERYATELLSGETSAVGYLLKQRVADVRDFLDALERVAGGGTALDPEVVAQLLARARRHPHDELTPREREVLGLMAEGRSNKAICAKLFLSPKTVETHVHRIFQKLGLPPAPEDHRRVLAVLTYLPDADAADQGAP